MLNDVVIANKIYTKLILKNASALDDIAIKVIKQDAPDFLVPFKMINIDEATEIRYEIGDGMRLNYLSENMFKKDFVILLENMIRPFINCNDWFLDYHNLYLDTSYIFVGKSYSSVRYVYIPDINYKQDEESILNFFRDYVLNINLSDDPVYVMNLYRYMKEKNVSLVSILDYLTHDAKAEKSTYVHENNHQRQNLDNKMSSIISKSQTPGADTVSIGQNASNRLNMVEKNEESNNAAPDIVVNNQHAKKEFGKSDVKDALINNLFGEDEDVSNNKRMAKKGNEKKTSKEIVQKEKNKGFLGGIFGGGKNSTEKAQVQQIKPQNMQQRSSVQPQSMPEIQVQNNAFFEQEDVTFIETDAVRENDGTKLMLQLEEDNGYHFPKFIEIDLNKGYATIGRFDKAGNAQSDYNFEASLSFISRRHLRVEKIGEQYRVVDLGSGNGTIVNDEVLVANMPYAVKTGDRIIFSKKHKITYRIC